MVDYSTIARMFGENKYLFMPKKNKKLEEKEKRSREAHQFMGCSVY